MAINKQNLRVPTSEEARRNGRKGGLASAASRRRKKELQERIQLYLSLPINDADPIEDVKSFKDFGKKNTTLMDGVIMKQVYKAFVNGDTKAFESLCRMGGMLEENVAVQVAGSIDVTNPYAGLSEEELRKLAQDD